MESSKDAASAGRRRFIKTTGFTGLGLLVLLFISSTCTGPGGKQPVDYVDPLIDSYKSRWFYFSSACRPFGLVNLSPDTWAKGSWNSGYLYDSLHVRCFSHLHAWQMSGIPVMPTSGEFRGHLGMEANKSAFSHEDEIVAPGYHKLFLKDYGITAELTSTVRTGFHRYTFPEGDDGYVLFDVGAYLGHGPVTTAKISQVSDTEIEGYSLMSKTRRRQNDTYVYFVTRFDRPFENFGGWKDGEVLESSSIEGPGTGGYVQFAKGLKEPVLMKVGISYTSMENARKNMETELAHWDFDRVRQESREEWNRWLSRIEVEGGTEPQRIKFYTDLWHSLLGRRIVSDVDGSYCDMTGDKPVIRKVTTDIEGKPQYNHHSSDSFWGSHWTINILWSFAYPEVMDEFCNTLLEIYRHGGLIPRGPAGGDYSYVMMGDQTSPFFAAAWNKGIRNYDIDLAWEGLLKNTEVGGIRDHAGYEFENPSTGGGMKYYVKRGYVPEGVEGNGWDKDGVAMTLEYAYQDWCVAQVALTLGKEEDYNRLMERSKNYRNMWNDSVRFMYPRDMDGNWLKEFAPVGEGPTVTTGFCESNSAIYTNFVPHDMPGLMELFGGREAYTEFLNSSFEKASANNFIAEHGNHGWSWVDYENQPSTQMAHLFNYSGAPWLSQKWVREVHEKAFGGITPYSGYNGDEDQGQMGALGVLMAIGLFSVDGGAAVEPVYEITSPVFDRIIIHLDPRYYPGGKFEIVTRNNSPENMYIQSARLNRKDHRKFWFRHDELAGGGKLVIDLGPEPNKSWGISHE
ncbi:MAG: GH92 family glycosyl hydrolase [Bacteroidota bacterium]